MALAARTAASPCPPPPPPVFDPPDCPVAVPVSTGTMSPGCFGGDCNSWGVAKIYDSKTKGLSSLAHTSSGAFPYFQLDLSASAQNVSSVRIVARADGWLQESQYLNVYISATPSFNAASTATLCASNTVFASLGETATVLCPVGLAWSTRYVTVQMNSSANPQFNGYLSLQEVTPLYDGERVCRRVHASLLAACRSWQDGQRAWYLRAAIRWAPVQ